LFAKENKLLEQGMRRKGFILIYVFILAIPILLVCGTLLNIVLLDYKTNLNISKKQQAYNNAEAGRLDALNRLSIIDFSRNRYFTYYLRFEEGRTIYDTTTVESKDYVKVTIQANLSVIPKEYVINIIGDHTGYTCPRDTIYYKE
jgi:hypothetical protein